MRIIAGSRRGLRLSAPRGFLSRPVLDRVKQAWFDVLGERVCGARVLDLYAGVGSLGLEALSRGAESCVFVELSPACTRLLTAHLERSGFARCSRVLEMPVEAALAELASRPEERFGLVFVDPPFELARQEAFVGPGGTLEMSGACLSSGGLLCFRRESPRRARHGQPQPDEVAPRGLVGVDRRRWGRSEVLFYARSPAPWPGGGKTCP